MMKLKRYVREARQMSCMEILRRAPCTAKREFLEGIKHFRWRFAPPAIRNPFPALGDDWAKRFLPEPFVSGSDRVGTCLSLLDEKTRKRIVACAEETARGTFDLLGSGPRELGLPPDWHRDFLSGASWPRQKAAHEVRYHTVPGADLKTPWELSRANWLPGLALAWWMEPRPEFINAARLLWLDWIEKNPPARGVNWACAMDVGMRAVNWIWALAILDDAVEIDGQTRQRVLDSLWTHGHFVRQHLEYSPVLTSNHYLGDLIGLFHVGLLFQASVQGRQWLDFAWSELQVEIEKQVAPDGTDMEASTSYHRLVLEFFTIAALLAKRNGIPASESFTARLRAMFDFTKSYIRTDGAAPQIGDNDSGRCFTLYPRSIDDHRYLLSWGALLFEDPSLKIANHSLPPESLLFFGSDAMKTWKQWTTVRTDANRCFPDFGLAILEDAAVGDRITCFSGPVGHRGKGGHTHNDKLALELVAAGRPFLVDPGTGCYTPKPEWKRRFRSTASHTTLQLGDEEQAPFSPTNLFRLDKDPKAEVIEYATTKRGGRIVGRHHGWTRFDPPRIHQREIEWDRVERRWTICDRLLPGEPLDGDPIEAPASSEIRIHWILHPDVEIETPEDGSLWLSNAGVRISLRTKTPCRSEVVPWWFSPEYGVWRDTRKIVMFPDPGEVIRDGFETRLRVEATEANSRANSLPLE